MALQPPTAPMNPMPSPQMMGGKPGMPPPPGMRPAPLPPGGVAPGAPLPPGAGGPPQEEEQLATAGGFFDQPWVQNVLPLVTSLVAHAVIIILGAVVFAVATGAIDPKKILQVEQTVVPVAAAPTSKNLGGVLHVGTNNNPNQEMFQDKVDAGTPDGNSSKSGPSIDPSAGESGGNGVGPATSLNGSGPGGGFGGGTGIGGSGKGGALARFGPPGGGAAGPKGAVFGNGGNARNIVFVCDASGSMQGKFASLKDELNKAIAKLRIPQSFEVIFFQDGKATVFSRDAKDAKGTKFFPEGMILASPDTKRLASGFLEEVTVASTSDPMPGLTAAFARHADLIYLLTDGDFPDNEAVKKKIKELNKPGPDGKKTKINTIAFVNNKDTDVAFIALLEGIAKENDGTFNKVDEDKLSEEQ